MKEVQDPFTDGMGTKLIHGKQTNSVFDKNTNGTVLSGRNDTAWCHFYRNCHMLHFSFSC